MFFPFQVIVVIKLSQTDQGAEEFQEADMCPAWPLRQESVHIGRGWKPAGLVICDGKEDNGKVGADPAPRA